MSMLAPQPESGDLSRLQPPLRPEPQAAVNLTLAGGLSARIESDAPIGWGCREALLAGAYLPGCRAAADAPAASDLRVKHFETPERNFIQGDGQVMVSDLWRGALPLDLWHLLYGMQRVELLRSGLYPVHGACVGKERPILLVGHSGTGKTALLLELALHHRLPVFSGDKTVVSLNVGRELTAVAGTQTITLRQADLPEALRALPRQDYGDRTALRLTPESYAAELSAPIKAVVMVQLNDGAERCEKLSAASALHTLYPFFLDTENSDKVVCCGAGVFVGSVPEGVPAKLARELAQVLETLPAYVISGSRQFVAERIRWL